MISIAFIIRSLEVGGAERQLIELCRSLDKAVFKISVLTFYDGGVLRQELMNIPDVNVISLKKKSRYEVLKFLWRIKSALRSVNPDIIHGYMSGANEISLLFGLILKKKVVWGMRCSNLDFNSYPKSVRFLYWFGGKVSRFCDLVIANSSAGKSFSCSLGYPPSKTIVISNGIDVNRFVRNDRARLQLRSGLGIEPSSRVIGMVGRYDPMKGHDLFLQAASLARSKRSDLCFVCVGGKMTEKAKDSFLKMAQRLELGNSIHFLNQCDDIERVYCMFDVCTSTSKFGEGFSNSIAEAMSCEVPCVATDVGDASLIVGNTGAIVPPNDATRLADAWLHVLSGDTRLLGERARARIVKNYSSEVLGKRTAEVLQSLFMDRK